MHNNAAFLSRLSSNAYAFDKREVRFHLRKSVATFAKKIIMVNGTFINQSIIYFNKLRQRAKKTRSKYERV